MVTAYFFRLKLELRCGGGSLGGEKYRQFRLNSKFRLWGGMREGVGGNNICLVYNFW